MRVQHALIPSRIPYMLESPYSLHPRHHLSMSASLLEGVGRASKKTCLLKNIGGDQQSAKLLRPVMRKPRRQA